MSLVNRRIALALVVLSALLTGVLILSPDRYSRGMRWRATRAWLILTGRLIDVGGYRLRIECAGSGTPTVVFDGGLNQPRKSWGQVPGKVEEFARVCTYERAGVGESDSAGFKRTSADAVRELRTLLEKAGEHGPFVLVGHSFGGENVRLFATEYPQQVTGLVLIDPSHSDQYELIASKLPVEKASEYLRHERGENDEKIDIITSSNLAQSKATPSTMPAVLLSAGESEDISPEKHFEIHTNLMSQYTCGRLVRVPNADHFIQLANPDVVTETIRAVAKGGIECSSTPEPQYTARTR